MQKWEYFTSFVSAATEEPEPSRKDNQRWNQWHASRFAPQSLLPYLNDMGENGWELIHIEPIPKLVSGQAVEFPGQYPEASHIYFCAWKRLKQEVPSPSEIEIPHP